MKIFDIPDSKFSDINIIIIILPHAKNGWILRVSAWFHQNALLGNHLHWATRFDLCGTLRKSLRQGDTELNGWARIFATHYRTSLHCRGPRRIRTVPDLKNSKKAY